MYESPRKAESNQKNFLSSLRLTNKINQKIVTNRDYNYQKLNLIFI